MCLRVRMLGQGSPLRTTLISIVKSFQMPSRFHSLFSWFCYYDTLCFYLSLLLNFCTLGASTMTIEIEIVEIICDVMSLVFSFSSRITLQYCLYWITKKPPFRYNPKYDESEIVKFALENNKKSKWSDVFEPINPLSLGTDTRRPQQKNSHRVTKLWLRY